MADRRPASSAVPCTMRLPFGVVAVFAALAVVVLGVLHAGQTVAGSFDRWALSAIGGAAFEPSPVRTIALIVDFCSEPAGAAVLATALTGSCLALRRPRLAALAVAGPGLTILTTTMLKQLTGRTINGDHLAYPSGHTATLTALAFITALLLVTLCQAGRAVGVTVVLGAATVAGTTMAWSQIVLTAHYASDTVGGFCTALAIVPATAWVLDGTSDRQSPKSGQMV
ncbi:MAG: phosphatase PAP2 family protein [Actinophytocola sp.]|nr:phosphatase PAP2 family protein [Actinophytocola sp.]